MVLKATDNDRRHLALCHDEFRGPRSGLCRSVAGSNVSFFYGTYPVFNSQSGHIRLNLSSLQCVGYQFCLRTRVHVKEGKGLTTNCPPDRNIL
ncbi:hypothetical protein TNCV_3167461 [Trichonephila clavipes]|uniref:Uncharacterized protein n=1 Tax=Trichonephila clavipes TaxID=2585209 RepID=A0A8X6RI66_TRICX|nr:hypothetical protein TNCV_3167461 [Trichonephila clavipes]